MIGLKAVNCETEDVLAETQEQAAGKEAVLKALDAAAVSMRSKLGESLSSVQRYATPLREATTPSLEALKIYSLGMKTWSTKGTTAALPFFKRAVELDPSFAEAYSSISATYANLNEVGRAAENARKAYELREKVSELERFAIETNYYEVATGECGEGDAGARTVAADLSQGQQACQGTGFHVLPSWEITRRHWSRPERRCPWGLRVRSITRASESSTWTSTD